MSIFSETLIRLREEKGYSRYRLSEESDISPSEIAELENGKRYPQSSTVQKLAAALDISPSVLIKALQDENNQQQ